MMPSKRQAPRFDCTSVRRLVGFLALSALVMASAPHPAAASARGDRVVMVVAGNLSIRDVVDPALPGIGLMLSEGSAALVNVRTGRPNKLIEPADDPGMEPGCLSLGAGAMAIGGCETRRAADAHDLDGGIAVRDVYAFRTGRGPGRAEVIHTEIPRIQRANAAASYHALPGALGSALRDAGASTAVIGNSDLPGKPHREAVAIAMDERGLVDMGSVSSPNLTVTDPLSPYGVATDCQALLREFDRVSRSCSFIVVDFGDTFRADTYAESCADDRSEAVRTAALRRLDTCIKRLSERLDPRRDTLMLVSPSSRTFSDLEEERLTLLVIRGASYRAGLLTSPSTRKPGLVTVSDIAPTVMALLGVRPPAGMAGRPIRRVRDSNPSESLLRMNLDACLQAQRQSAMRGASVAQSVVVAIVTLALLLSASPALRRHASWIALVPAALPLVMLHLPLFYSGGVIGAVAWLVTLTPLVVLACALMFRSPMRALAWICAALVLSLVVDVARGAPLISSSIAGYSMVEGARYYGIGNELAGTLIGAALIGLGIILSGSGPRIGRPGILAAAVLGLVFVTIGGSGLGANAGGAASAAPAIVVMLLVRRGWKPGGHGLLLVLLVSALVVGGLFALDAARSGGAQSHIGRAAGMVAADGSAGIIEVARRKLALNLMLVGSSLWSRLLGLSLVGSAALYWSSRRRLGDKLLDREIGGAALGCCVATALTFVLNDSGVLSAAAASVFLWMLLAVRTHQATSGPAAQES